MSCFAEINAGAMSRLKDANTVEELIALRDGRVSCSLAQMREFLGNPVGTKYVTWKKGRKAGEKTATNSIIKDSVGDEGGYYRGFPSGENHDKIGLVTRLAIEICRALQI